MAPSMSLISTLPKKLADTPCWQRLVQANRTLADQISAALTQSPIAMPGAHTQVMQLAAALASTPLDCVNAVIAARLNGTIEGLPPGPQRTQLTGALQQLLGQRADWDGSVPAWPVTELTGDYSQDYPQGRIEPGVIYQIARPGDPASAMTLVHGALVVAHDTGDLQPVYVDVQLKNVQTGRLLPAPVQMVWIGRYMPTETGFSLEPSPGNPPGVNSVMDVLHPPSPYQIESIAFSKAGFPSRLRSAGLPATEDSPDRIMTREQWAQKLKPFFFTSTQQAVQSLYRNAGAPYGGVASSGAPPHKATVAFERGDMDFVTYGVAALQAASGQVHVYEAVFTPTAKLQAGQLHPDDNIALRLYDAQGNLVRNPPAGRMTFFSNAQMTARQANVDAELWRKRDAAFTIAVDAETDLHNRVGRTAVQQAAQQVGAAAGLTQSEQQLYHWMVTLKLGAGDAKALLEQAVREDWSADSPYTPTLITQQLFDQLLRGLLEKLTTTLKLNPRGDVLAQAQHDYEVRVQAAQALNRPTPTPPARPLLSLPESTPTPPMPNLAALLSSAVSRLSQRYNLDLQSGVALNAVASSMVYRRDVAIDLRNYNLTVEHAIPALAEKLRLNPQLSLVDKINAIKDLLIEYADIRNN
jgi:hypothetical protein